MLLKCYGSCSWFCFGYVCNQTKEISSLLVSIPSHKSSLCSVIFLDDLSNSNEWNPDIISGVVRPPEQIKLVHGMEALRSVSSSSSPSGIF